MRVMRVADPGMVGVYERCGCGHSSLDPDPFPREPLGARTVCAVLGPGKDEAWLSTEASLVRCEKPQNRSWNWSVCPATPECSIVATGRTKRVSDSLIRVGGLADGVRSGRTP